MKPVHILGMGDYLRGNLYIYVCVGNKGLPEKSVL